MNLKNFFAPRRAFPVIAGQRLSSHFRVAQSSHAEISIREHGSIPISIDATAMLERYRAKEFLIINPVPRPHLRAARRATC